VEYPRFAEAADPSLAQDTGMTDNPWPSSDWVAFLTERGLVAAGCLALALLILMWQAVMGVRAQPRGAEAVASLVLIGTVAAMGVVGSFDAGLLLAAPSLGFWAACGALSRQQDTIRFMRRKWLIPVVMLSVLSATRGGFQWAAMATSNGTSRLSRLERASQFDPGSYRIHLRAANSAADGGNCRAAIRHASAAASLFPAAREPRRLLARCR
jgi:hypothetical protein